MATLMCLRSLQECGSVYDILDGNWLVELKLDRNWQDQYQMRCFYQKSQ